MKFNLFCILIFSMSSIPAFAAELVIKPGLWESTSTRISSMGGDKVTTTERECIKEKSFDPQEMMQEMRDCKFIENELKNKHTLVFKMECSMQGAKASLKGKYYTKGDVGKGDMRVDVDMGGMKMNMDLTWDAKRVGDC